MEPTNLILYNQVVWIVLQAFIVHKLQMLLTQLSVLQENIAKRIQKYLRFVLLEHLIHFMRKFHYHKAVKIVLKGNIVIKQA